MTDSIDDRLAYYLSKALQGSLMAQYLRAVGIDPVDLEPGDPTFHTAAEAIEAQGYDADEISRHVISFLVYIFSRPENASQLVDIFATLLWRVLGDPKSGAPPVLYKKAATYIHTAVIGLLDPNFLESCSNQR